MEVDNDLVILGACLIAAGALLIAVATPAANSGYASGMPLCAILLPFSRVKHFLSLSSDICQKGTRRSGNQ
jgi:hypothetical protein